MLTLNDGRSELWQWDTGRKLNVDADCSQVHFSNKVFGRSIDVDVIDGVANIPDILLQTDKELTAWAFAGTSENGYTKISKTFHVNRRNRPADYVFTPPDQTSIEEIKEKLEYLESIQDPDAIENAVEDYLEKNPVEAPVQSVNGKTGKVNLTAKEVGAFPQDASVVKTVNGTAPDSNGNVEITIPDSGGNSDYPNWSHLKWYVMGDSFTAQDNDFTPKRYYDFIHDKTGIQLIVDGIGGTGYGAGVSNNQSFFDRIKNIPDDVDVVTIYGSGNDIRYEVNYNAPVYNTLSWIVFNRPGLRVIVVPPSPWLGYQKREDPWKAYCDRLQVCAMACDFRYLSDMWECPPFNPNFEGHMEKFFTTDPEGIHPNEAGHEALATYFYNALAQELEFDAGSGINDSGGNVDLTGVVKSVNGQTPDENGNVEISASGGTSVSPIYLKKWACLGDSVTMGGYLVDGETVKTYHDFVSEKTGVSVLNYGRGGSTITSKNDGYSYCERYSSMDTGADFVTVFGGINDYTGLINIGSEETTDDITTLYGAMHFLCKGLLKMYLAKPIGFILPYGFNEFRGAGTWKPYEDAMVTVLNYYGIPYLNLRTNAPLNANIDWINETYFKDGDKTHPNTNGSKIIATPIIRFLESIYVDYDANDLPAFISVESVSVNTSELVLNVDEEYKLDVNITPINATNKTVMWKSSNESIATVTEDGTVKGIALGNCIVTATTVDGGKTSSCTISVTEEQTANGMVETGLTAHYLASDYENGSTSATWADKTGNGYDLTLSGFDYSETNGWKGDYLAFYGEVSASPFANALTGNVPYAGEMTVEICFNPLKQQNSILLEISEFARVNLNSNIGGLNGSIYYEKADGTKATRTLSSMAMTIGDVMHTVTITRNASKICVYIDGTLMSTYETSSISDFAKWVTVADSMTLNTKPTAWNSVNMNLYLMRFYNRVLSDDEIMQNKLYNDSIC